MSKVSIGLPVYNGEKFIGSRISSILEQTFFDFELIISDNSSTDNTPLICKEFVSKDNRIHYFRQEKNKGVFHNFKYLLEKAHSKYFVWAGVDDIWSNEFLEESVKVLEKNQNVVGSICKIEPYGKKIEYKPGRLSKKIRYFSYDNYSHLRSYEERVKFYLRFWSNENIYGLFRTKELKKSFLNRPMAGLDKATLLNLLTYGEIHISNKILMRRFSEGFTITGSVMDKLTHLNSYGIVGILFPFLPFTFWCAKNLGIKIFIGNLDYFLYINFAREKLLLGDLTRRLKNKLSH